MSMDLPLEDDRPAGSDASEVLTGIAVVSSPVAVDEGPGAAQDFIAVHDLKRDIVREILTSGRTFIAGALLTATLLLIPCVVPRLVH